MSEQAQKLPTENEQDTDVIETVAVPVEEYLELQSHSNELYNLKRQRELDIETAVKSGQYEAKGVMRMDDAKGRGHMIDGIDAHEVIADEAVRRILFFGEELAARVARFKGHAFKDMHGLQALLEQEYGVESGGKKGNITYSTFDGSMKVEIKIAELQEFGPQIDIAQQLFTDCVAGWANGADGQDQLLDIIETAFGKDGGHYNRNDLLSLLRRKHDDEKWQAAQKALVDAIKSNGTKARIYLSKRTGIDGKWETVVISLANS